MKVLAGSLYCEFSDLLNWGVSETYLWKVCSQARAGAGRSWVNIPDPADARRVLVAYDSIPAQTLASKQIPAKETLLTQLRAAELAAATAARETATLGLLQYLEPVCKRDKEALNAARIGREMADLGTGEVRKREETGIPAATMTALIEQCRWLRLIGDERWKLKSNRQKVGYDSLKDLQLACVAAAEAVGVKLPTNYSKLQAKLRDYKADPANLIPGTFGKQNARKVTEEVLEFLTVRFADGSKPDFTKVWGWYEQARANRADVGGTAWPELSVSAIKQNLLAPDVMPVWYLGRHGKAAWRAKFEYTIQRRRPTFRDALWVIDGTKVNYFYQGGKGTPVAALTIVAVVDAHSEYILGWAIVEGAEDGATSRAALRLAIERAGGVLPVQVQSDNGGANRGLAQAWNEAGALWTLAQAHNGQSKMIESELGRLQDQVMRANPAFTGQNLTAKTLDSRANPEVMDAARRGLWTREEAIAQAERDLHIWNNLKQKRDGRTPAERYHASQHPWALETLTPEQEAALFWEWNTVRDSTSLATIQHRRDGLAMTHRGRKYQYEVVDAAGVPDVDFLARWGTESFAVKYDPAAPGTGLALFTAKDRRFVAWAVAKKAMAYAVADQEPGERATINTRLQVKKGQHAAASEALAGAKERDAADPRLPYSWFDKEAEARGEEAYLTHRFGPATTTTAVAPTAELVPVLVEPEPETVADAKYRAFLAAQRAAQQDDWLTP